MDIDEFGLYICVRRHQWVIHRGSKGDMIRGGEEEKTGYKKVDDGVMGVCGLRGLHWSLTATAMAVAGVEEHVARAKGLLRDGEEFVGI